MIKIVGVRFRTAGKIYYFDPKKLPIKKGDHVIVETARGVEYGSVVANPREVPDDQVVQPLKAVMRIATAEDDARVERNNAREKDAMRICAEKIRKHKLDMKRSMQNIRLTTTKFCFILQQMAELISVSWLRIWHLFSKPESSFARSV